MLSLSKTEVPVMTETEAIAPKIEDKLSRGK